MDELRQAQKATVGLAKGGGDKRSDHRVARKPTDPPTLAEAGIDKNLAKEGRKLGRSHLQGLPDRTKSGRRAFSIFSVVGCKKTPPLHPGGVFLCAVRLDR